MAGPLEGILVVALEQAVAAPLASSRLADAGARVIKLERSEGDFARGYDGFVHGQSSYFVWNNRGKESCVVDLKKPEDLALVEAMLASADVFVQNLAPGATDRLGIGKPRCREGCGNRLLQRDNDYSLERAGHQAGPCSLVIGPRTRRHALEVK